MRNLTLSSASLALAAAMAFTTPASAQLLGGSGGIGGNLGGQLGSTLGGPLGSTLGDPVGRTTGTIDSQLRGSGHGDAKVDRRSGHVQGSGNGDAHGQGSVDGSSNLFGNPLAGMASGSADASGQGSLDAQLIGTDAVGQVARGVTGTARSAAGAVAGRTRSAAGSAIGNARGVANGARGMAGAAGSASGNGMFQGSLGQLAAQGSGAASGNGMFAVAPGMPVTDPRGKVIGYVQQVRQTGRGVVQAVSVEVGDRLATLPAASFAGSGDVLVTGMTKGQLKSVAEEQEDAQ